MALSIRWLLRRNDEIPLLISGFLLYCGAFRYLAVTLGWSRGWVQLQNFGFMAVTREAAEIALGEIVLGELFLLVGYAWWQRRSLINPPPLKAGNGGEQRLLQWLRPRLLVLGLIMLQVVVVLRSQLMRQLRAGQSIAFEISGYLYLFPLALVGVATLVLCVWKRGGFSSWPSRIIAALIMMTLSQMTFGSTGRFQFLGWLVAAGVTFSSTYRPRVRLLILTAFATVGLSLFAIAGTLRGYTPDDANFRQATWERAFSAEDANMLDGFVLLQQVYPNQLPYSLGGEHLEILMRPIPRSLWPGKPVGGYMNKLGLITPQSGFTLGISPTIFGSFYAEGGTLGVAFLALVYGGVLARLVRLSTQLQPFAGLLLRAILCASLVPLLRGGDLPGIYAWIGMAFWPCFLVLWLKRRWLATVRSPQLHYPPQG
ncbi:oligosaccharide repeat unit polymerase [Leptolyngbya sp. FACHB-16]|nr:oligosaccharide repeat unit polymerase [Leptolyngbya sp. FACHB-16]